MWQTQVRPIVGQTQLSACSTLGWIDEQVQLRYFLGEVCLFRIGLAGKIYRWSLDQSPYAHPEPTELAIEIPKNISVVVYRGYPISEHLPRLRVFTRSIRYVDDQGYRYYTDLQGSFEDYLTKFSRKTRETLRRKVKKVAVMNGGAVDCRVYCAPHQMAEYYRLAREVAVKSYSERLFQGGIPDNQAFRDGMCRLAKEDRVRGFVLFIRNQPISYLYLTIENGIVRSSYLGYNLSYSGSSPGTVLLYLAFETLFSERRFRYFDFGYANNQTAHVFSTGKFLRADVYYFSKRVVNYSVVYTHAAIELFSIFSGRALEAFGLKGLFKKVLRWA